MEKITDEDLLRDVLWDDAEGYKHIKTFDDGTSRWHILKETVFMRESDSKLFITYWRAGATEMQESDWPEEAVEAEEYTETVVRYREKK